MGGIALAGVSGIAVHYGFSVLWGRTLDGSLDNRGSDVVVPDDTVTRDLDPEEFPMTIIARLFTTQDVVWAVTILRPPSRTRVPLYIPPLAKIFGGPIEVTTIDGMSREVTTGPWE